MVRKSPYIIFLVFWQIIRCCLLQFDNADIEDNDEDYDDKDYNDEEEDVDEEDAEEELSSKDLGLPIDIDLPMQQIARTIAALEHIDMDTKRPLCILNGKGETRRQVSGVYLELIYDLINGHVMHLCTDQTTRVSNGLPKFAIVMALCYFRDINLAIASQIGIPPMSIAEADQLSVSHMEAKLNQFRATFRENSNKDSELFLLEKRIAWNEHCQLPATSSLQKSLIELDEMARQNRLIERAEKKAATKAADKLAAAINYAEKAKMKAAKLASYKLQTENTLAKLASYKRAEENRRVAAANEAVDKLVGASSSKIDSKWVCMFECLEMYIEGMREKATRHMNDEQKAAWIWDGNVPQSFKTPCGKALGRWIDRQRQLKAKEIPVYVSDGK
jgi:hypothetical protein